MARSNRTRPTNELMKEYCRFSCSFQLMTRTLKAQIERVLKKVRKERKKDHFRYEARQKHEGLIFLPRRPLVFLTYRFTVLEEIIFLLRSNTCPPKVGLFSIPLNVPSVHLKQLLGTVPTKAQVGFHHRVPHQL